MEAGYPAAPPLSPMMLSSKSPPTSPRWGSPAGVVSRKEWKNDAEVTNCAGCTRPFSLTRRRHHCRRCGDIFCNPCSAGKEIVDGSKKEVRVCNGCSQQTARGEVRQKSEGSACEESMGGDGEGDDDVSDDDIPEHLQRARHTVHALSQRLVNLRGEVAREEARLGSLHEQGEKVAALEAQVALLQKEMGKREREGKEREARADEGRVNISRAIEERAALFACGRHHEVACAICGMTYSFLSNREHHCRVCFRSVCGDCSRGRVMRGRVCNWCMCQETLLSPEWMGEVRQDEDLSSVWAMLLHSKATSLWETRVCKVSSPPNFPLSFASSSVNTAAERERPHWQDDSDWPSCGHHGCSVRFSSSNRRHHCRRCGFVFCSQHCNIRVPLPHLGYSSDQRVCSDCYNHLTSTDR